MKEHKIGETFEYGDVVLRVEKPRVGCLCYDCYFAKLACCSSRQISNTGYCVKGLRKDRTFVIFKEVK